MKTNCGKIHLHNQAGCKQTPEFVKLIGKQMQK